MRSTRRFIVTLGLFLLVSAGLGAQPDNPGHLTGKVTDETGRPIEGVRVTVLQPPAVQGAEAETDAQGNWLIGGMTRGEWYVIFDKPGLAPRTIRIRTQELVALPVVRITLRRAAS